MPRIGIIRNTIGKVHYELPYHYTETLQFHIKELDIQNRYPDDFLHIVKYKMIKYKTQDDLETAHNNAVRDYIKIMTKIDKVILISLKVNLSRILDDNYSKYGRATIGDGVSKSPMDINGKGIGDFAEKIKSANFGYDEISGAGLEIEYWVRFHKKLNDKNEFYTILERDGEEIPHCNEYHNDHSIIIIPWTEQREKFFEETQLALDKLSKSIALFLSNNTDELTKAIDSGITKNLLSTKV